MGSGTLSGGIVTYTTTSLSVGIHSITASYPGDDNNTASVSGIFSQTVNKATTTTILTSNPNPSTKYQLVTFSATVNGSNPTGSVIFKDGTSIIGKGTVSGGIAIYKTSSLTRKTHSITATYQGDNSNTASASATLSQVVN